MTFGPTPERSAIVRSIAHPPPIDDASATAERPTRVRYVVLLALAAAAIFCYLLRTSVSNANTTIQRDLGIDNVAMGYVLGGFFFGYTWFQIPAGWLGDRLGARFGLTLMGSLWASLMALTASSRSLEVLRWSWIAQGVAQAGVFAVTIKALADWFPASRRGMTSAVITACMSVGAVAANALTGRLIGPIGWRLTFFLYATVVAGWTAVFFAWFRDRPEVHPGVNRAERTLIQDGLKLGPQASASPSATLPALLGMACSVSMGALCVQAFFRSFGYALFITWFPAYLEKGHGLSVERAGDYTAMPLIGVVLGCFLGGWLVDRVLERTGSRRWSRSGVATAALGLCALSTLAATLPGQPLAVVVLVSIGALLSGISGPTTWAATVDLCAGHSAVGFAVMNMAGNLGAIACPVVLGYLIEHLEKTRGDWNTVLYLFAAIYLAGAVSWLFLDPDRPAVS